MARRRQCYPIQRNLSMLKIEYAGCEFWVPDWTQYIGREADKRIVALDCYPVWDEELRQLRRQLLEPRTRENTRFWYIGLDGEAVLREGVDVVPISRCVVRRSAKISMAEGAQEITKNLSRKPIWER